MKKVIMSIIALAVISMTIGFVACNKEKDTINEKQNQNENVERKPIAVKNTKTGVITYTLDSDHLQNAFDAICEKKGEESNYIFEGLEILDNNAKGDESEMRVKYSILDTDKEVSRTFWLSKEFVETKEDKDQVSYYFDEDVTVGNYSFVSYFKDVAYVVTVRDHNYTYTPIEEVDKASVPKKRQVSCESQNCRVGTCIPMNYGDWGWGCSPCEVVGEPSFCTTHVGPDNTWDKIMDWLTNLFNADL